MPRPPQPDRPSRRAHRAGLGLLLLTFLLGTGPLAPARAQEVPQLQITSKRYIVIDGQTGEIYAQRRAHERAAMASLTKVFTAIEAIEEGAATKTFTTDASDVFDSSSTTMGIQAGQTYTFDDLLYGMLLPSGNDAAHAIARNLGYQPGDTDAQAVKRFVDRVNQRLQDMGLVDTHLVRPDGWGVPGHYTTVYDLAAFMMYAIQYPAFVKAISTPSYTTTNGIYVTNTNKMLNWFPGIVGGKTGYDNDAGYCLIEVAQRDGSTMISVTLDGVAPNDWYDDNRVLLDYAFKQKAARVAAGRPITGQVVSYKDPDAARIGRSASGGASLGGAPLPAAPAPAPAAPKPAPVVVPAPGANQGGLAAFGGLDARLLAALGVAVLILAVRAGQAFTAPVRRRSPPPLALAPESATGHAELSAPSSDPAPVGAS